MPASTDTSVTDAALAPVVSYVHDLLRLYERAAQEGVGEGERLVDLTRPDPPAPPRTTFDTRLDAIEIFGPVLQIVCAESFEEALQLPTKHQYGNGVAIFTRNGAAAREFAARVEVGMVGINVPIPVPVAYHTFGGWKRSAFGDTNQHGLGSVDT